MMMIASTENGSNLNIERLEKTIEGAAIIVGG